MLRRLGRIGLAAFVGVFLLASTPSQAADLTGRASVIDGDTIDLDIGAMNDGVEQQAHPHLDALYESVT